MINPSLYADEIYLPSDIKKKNHKFFCNICALGKSTHHVPKSHNDPQWSKKRRLNDDVEFEFDKRRTSHPFDLMYSDLSGIAPVPSIEAESNSYMTFIDGYTRITWVVFLTDKPAADPIIRGFIAMVETQFDAKVKYMFTDNGTKYVNQSVQQFLLEKGIVHDLMPPYCHEYNGTAERFNRTLLTMVRMMLMQREQRVD